MDELNPSISVPNSEPAIAAKRRIIFESFEFRPSESLLLYKDAPCNLEPKMLEFLRIIVDARPNFVSKDELMTKLWPDSSVSDWSLARLVSDTRKLIEDDVKQQTIIKTVRGKGYAFVARADEIIEAYPKEHQRSIDLKLRSGRRGPFNTTKNPDFRLAWLSSLIFLIAATLLIYFSQYQFSNDSGANQPIVDHDSQSHKLEVMRQIQKNLRLTKTTFQAQVRRRNELGDLLLTKSPEEKPITWEQRFRIHYPNLSEREKFIFEQIKAMTAGPLNKGNSDILFLLDEHPEMYREIDTFTPLHSHLQIWKSKFDNVFKQREDMGLVYVGVEDGVPFPSEIDELVDSWIIENSRDLDQVSTLASSNSK